MEQKALRGLMVSVLEDKLTGNCSNNGISNHCDAVILVGEGVPEIFAVSEEHPAVKLIKRKICGKEYIHAEPVEGKRSNHNGWMMGGCFVYSCDSRFKNINACPIPLHDRQEMR